MDDPIVSPRVYVKNFSALLALLLLTVCAARIDLGPLNLAVAMTVSVVKTALIVLFFMHMRWSRPVLHLAAMAGVCWLAIMLILVLSDYGSRGW